MVILGELAERFKAVVLKTIVLSRYRGFESLTLRHYCQRRLFLDHIDKDIQDEGTDFSFDDLDNEVGLGNILKEKDNFFFTLFKKLVFAIVIIIIGVIVFFASFTIGKMMFLAEDTSTYHKDQFTPKQTTKINQQSTAPTREASASIKSTKDKDAIREIPAQQMIPINSKQTPQSSQTETQIKESIKSTVKKVEVKEVADLPYYMVIVGTFSKIQNARTLSSSLQKASFNPSIKKITAANGNTLYRVIAGIYKGLPETKKQIQILKSKGIDCFYQQFKE